MDAKLHTAKLRKGTLEHGRSRATSLRLLKDHSPRFKDEGKLYWGSDEHPKSGLLQEVKITSFQIFMFLEL